MSRADERRREQDAYNRDQDATMNERPVEVAIEAVPDRRSWASTCAGWRVGIHERTKENRVLGIWKCRWCNQTFNEPTADELAQLRSRTDAYQRPQVRSTRRW